MRYDRKSGRAHTRTHHIAPDRPARHSGSRWCACNGRRHIAYRSARRRTNSGRCSRNQRRRNELSGLLAGDGHRVGSARRSRAMHTRRWRDRRSDYIRTEDYYPGLRGELKSPGFTTREAEAGTRLPAGCHVPSSPLPSDAPPALRNDPATRMLAIRTLQTPPLQLDAARCR